MRHARRNLGSFVLAQNIPSTRNLQRDLSREHKEKLSRLVVKMPDFRCADRHAFAYYARPVAFDEMQTVAILSPRIMPRRVFADHECIVSITVCGEKPLNSPTPVIVPPVPKAEMKTSISPPLSFQDLHRGRSAMDFRIGRISELVKLNRASNRIGRN